MALALLLSPRESLVARWEYPRHQQPSIPQDPHLDPNRDESHVAGSYFPFEVEGPEDGGRGVANGKGMLVSTLIVGRW